ncbi:hypothetical protein CRUP_028763, partial [Coryphaenoides rupestris]
VWVNGIKLGTIAYLGETQFAPGQWAGVVLNDPVGKNDGTVGGVRYFECQSQQGIFTRPSKLTRQQVGDGSDSHSTDSQVAQGQAHHHSTGGGGGGGGGGGMVPGGQRIVVPLREGLLNSAVKTGNESGSNMSDSGSVKKGGDKDLRVGDRHSSFECLFFSPVAYRARLGRVVLRRPFNAAAAAASESDFNHRQTLLSAYWQTVAHVRTMCAGRGERHLLIIVIQQDEEDGRKQEMREMFVNRTVGGTKMGAVRYIGETDFAKGEWCGVELDEPLGKNDGAVAGTR